MEQLTYTVDDATIAHLLGVSNFSTPESAVLELVKNAYDAGATKLRICFGDDAIALVDTGKGMSREDIKEYWMSVGKTSKGYSEQDERGDVRIQAGSKGVGRFALARLGAHVTMRSKKLNAPGILWKTDWTSSYLGDLDRCDELGEKGTSIIVSGLRDKWSKKKVESLAVFLRKTYYDNKMDIGIEGAGASKEIRPYFDEPALGLNCTEIINLEFDSSLMMLRVNISSDEFEPSIQEAIPDVGDINSKHVERNVFDELCGSYLNEWDPEEFEQLLHSVGDFGAEFYFRLMGSTAEDEKYFFYRHRKLSDPFDSGVILYRNAFSISSFEGSRDWIGFGRRARRSPASPTNQTGSWRVRENQIAGLVRIDKQDNPYLQDLANRQGMEENVQYKLFLDIIDLGLKSFEEYRQSILRLVGRYRKEQEEKPDAAPVSDAILSGKLKLDAVSKRDFSELRKELADRKQQDRRTKASAAEIEERHRYDVRILNVLATAGLKASSIAHQLKNDENNLMENSCLIRNALIEYGLWEMLSSESYTRFTYNNIPSLLDTGERLNAKMAEFIDATLAEIEKKRFSAQSCDLQDELKRIVRRWEADYSQLSIRLNLRCNEIVKVPPDAIQVVFDNLILNTYQQNSSRKKVIIAICISESREGRLEVLYKDDGVGLPAKYKNQSRRILEVHETSRENGHGLGMWILNNTLLGLGGCVLDIDSEPGFSICFVLRG